MRIMTKKHTMKSQIKSEITDTGFPTKTFGNDKFIELGNGTRCRMTT